MHIAQSTYFFISNNNLFALQRNRIQKWNRFFWIRNFAVAILSKATTVVN